jgi:hypothetical protein
VHPAAIRAPNLVDARRDRELQLNSITIWKRLSD